MLNKNSVLEAFRNMADLTDEEALQFIGLVNSAKAYMERLLIRETADDGELELLTHACAAKTFFDYTVLLAATPKTYSTKSGSIFAKVSEDATVINAQTLMNNALAALPQDLWRNNGFIFEGVAG